MQAVLGRYGPLFRLTRQGLHLLTHELGVGREVVGRRPERQGQGHTRVELLPLSQPSP